MCESTIFHANVGYKIARTSTETNQAQSLRVGFLTQIVKFLYYLSNLNIKENLVGN